MTISISHRENKINGMDCDSLHHLLFWEHIMTCYKCICMAWFLCVYVVDVLPAPYHGQGQYSHQVGMQLTPGLTPNNSGIFLTKISEVKKTLVEWYTSFDFIQFKTSSKIFNCNYKFKLFIIIIDLLFLPAFSAFISCL